MNKLMKMLNLKQEDFRYCKPILFGAGLLCYMQAMYYIMPLIIGVIDGNY